LTDFSYKRAFCPFHECSSIFLKLETLGEYLGSGTTTMLLFDHMKQISNNAVGILQHFEGTQISGITSKAWFPREKMDSPNNLCLLALGLH
jgi:hypothetical protein